MYRYLTQNRHAISTSSAVVAAFLPVTPLSSAIKVSSSASSCSAVGVLDRTGFGAFALDDEATFADRGWRVRVEPALRTQRYS